MPASEKQIQLATEYRGNVDKSFHTRKGLDYALNDNKSAVRDRFEANRRVLRH
jgi:hypothetical protein